MAANKYKRTNDRRSTSGGLSITQLSKKPRLPLLPIRRMKDDTLGRAYALSLVLATDSMARKLNKRYRKKEYTPNVLAFPLDQKTGEIVLDLAQAKREHATRGESYRYFVALLIIHAMLHLKGHRHGGTMEKQEKALLLKFRVRNK
jgi:rRNA maturation RNase YbeY